jgi:hypothetical protein
MPHDKQVVTTRSRAGPSRKILVGGRWALALAWPGRVRRRTAPARCQSLATAAAIAALLLASPLPAIVAGPIALTGLPSSPTLRCLPTGGATVTGLGMRRQEVLLTAFEQATTGTPGGPGPWPGVSQIVK